MRSVRFSRPRAGPVPDRDLAQQKGPEARGTPRDHGVSAGLQRRQPRSLAEELDERALVPEGIEITVFHSDLAKAGPPLERNA